MRWGGGERMFEIVLESFSYSAQHVRKADLSINGERERKIILIVVVKIYLF